MTIGPGGSGGAEEAVGGNASRGWNLIINGSNRMYVRRAGVHADLFEERSGVQTLGYVVTDLTSKNKTFYYKSQGDGFFRVTKQADTHGNTITWRYDGLNRVDRMTDSTGRYIAISYVDDFTNAQIKDVKLITPQKTLTWTMNYGAINGRPFHLFSIGLPSPDSSTPSLVFNYDNQSNLTSTVDARGFAWGYAYDIDASNRLYVKRVYAPNATAFTGFNTSVSTAFRFYNQSSPQVLGQDERVCEITDPRGSIWKHVYELMGAVDSFVNPIRRIHFPATTADSGDRWQTFVWRYSDATLTSFTDARGYQWSYTYPNDNAGLPLTETDPNGLVIQHRYSNWLETTTINPFGVRTIHKYDPTYFDLTETIVDPKTDPNDGAYSKPAGLALKTAYGYTTGGELASTKVGSSEPAVLSNFDAYSNARTVTSPEGVVVTSTYDDRNRKLSETQLSPGATTTFLYDDWNRLVETRFTVIAGALPETIFTQYDLNGNVTSTTDARGIVRTKTYDQYNRVRTESTPVASGEAGITVETQYEPLGAWKKIINGRGKATTYNFDTRGKLTSVVDPLGKTKSFGYDQEGNVVGSQNARGQTTYNTYDPAGRLLFSAEPDGYGYEHLYRADGLRGAIIKRAGSYQTSPVVNTTSWYFDDAGRMVQWNQPESGKSVVQTYDDASRRRTLSVGGMTWTFNLVPGAGSRVDSVSQSLGIPTPVQYSYHPNGAVRTAFRMGKLSELRDYDPQGRPTYIQVSQLGANGWAEKLRVEQYHDPAGRMKDYLEADDGLRDGAGARNVIHSYGYDNANRLRTENTSATLIPNYVDAFNYDANGNRTTVSRNGAVATYSTANDNDQIAYGEGFTFGTYDNDGLVSGITVPGEGLYSFLYDHEGRPTRVTLPNASQVQYGYDAEGRLVSRTAGGATMFYVYGPDGQVIAEVAGGTGQVRRYRLAGVGDVEFAVGSGIGNDRAYLENPRGDTLAVYDVNANRLSRLSYRAYGEQEAIQNPGAAGPRRWGGRNGGFTDEMTGLVLFGARWYAPKLGRWLTPDPIGQEGGLNLYAYCDNDPVNKIDPLGLDGWDDTANFFGGWGDMLTFGATGAISQAINRNLGYGEFQYGGGWFYAGQGVGLAHSAYLGPGVMRVVATGASTALRSFASSSKFFAPQAARLFRATFNTYKATKLTVAGRGLTKHPEVAGFATDEMMRKVYRSEAAINEAAAMYLKVILRAGNRTVYNGGRYGNDVVQYRLKSGIGARWSADGNFIGFIGR